MGKYDNISPDELRADLIRFAELIFQLRDEEGILSSAAELQRLMGDLRRKLFAYEIRSTSRLSSEAEEQDPEGGDPGALDPLLDESLRVVREALERQEEMIEGWRRPFSPWDDEEEDA